MTHITTTELLEKITDAGDAKLGMTAGRTLVRAYMAGAILAIAAAFAITVTVRTGEPLVGAILFPVGFVLLSLLGFDLLTGVFTLAPLAFLDGRPNATGAAILRNWSLTFIGNLAGALTVALMMAVVLTFGFSSPPGPVGETIGLIGADRTVGYADHGAAGMLTLFTRAVLCNWMVSTAVVAGFLSTGTGGKTLVMAMPIMVFFYMGFEHSIVNMFLFPSGLMLGGPFSVLDYLLWNEIPTLFGNLVGGVAFVALPLYLAHGRH